MFKQVLGLAVLLSGALANNSTLTNATPTAKSGCSFSAYTATKSEQVAAIAACETAVGDISINGPGIGAIDLTGVKAIYGNLKINGTQAVAFNAPTLQLISSDFEITKNNILATVNLAQLTTVDSLTWDSLPALTQTGLTSGITSANSVIISNTGLTSLDGINVGSLKVFNVNNNVDINSINSGLQAVTEMLSITDNNSKQVLIKMDQLTDVSDLTFQKVSKFSVANLTSINGSLSISSSSLDEIKMPNIKSIGKSLTIAKNDELEKLDFSNLTSIGGALSISDNDKLKSFDGFSKLKTVGGSVSINGTFNNGSFSKLEKVAGGFTLLSDGDLSCSSFTDLNKKGDIRGDKFVCSGAGTASSSSSAKKSGSQSDSSSTEKSGSESSSKGKSGSESSSKDSAASTTLFSALFAAMAAFGVVLY